MKFLIITHVQHKTDGDNIYGYGPYIKEMNLWLKHVDQVRIVAPIKSREPDSIDLAYIHKNIIFDKVPTFNLLSISSKMKALLSLPYIFIKIILAMIWAEHIHLRCPGNMGLLGAIAQIFFPWKIKTVKYAGNWDPNSSQPFTYRLQKKIISNAKFSKKMSVLAYGKWPNQSKNIIEFFTASYSESEKEPIEPRSLNQEIKLVFVGALSSGKQPIIAVKAIHELIKKNVKAHLDLMGEGAERSELEAYISRHKLHNHVTLHGNQNSDFVKAKFISAHFLILMSKSEGWPKVVAEAMFWGAVPITTNVSCVNYMIGEGNRGALVQADGLSVANGIEKYIKKPLIYEKASLDAVKWSREFTLESFEYAIKGLLDE